MGENNLEAIKCYYKIQKKTSNLYKKLSIKYTEGLLYNNNNKNTVLNAIKCQDRTGLIKPKLEIINCFYES